MLPRRADAGTAAGNRRRTVVLLWNQRGARKRAPLLQNDLSKLARFLLRGGPGLVPNCARRTTTTLNASSKLARFSFKGAAW
jgi:hypothetical protein